MQKISVLGCGWLGLPLAKHLTENFKVLGSVRKISAINSLQQENIKPFLIDIDKGDLTMPADFLQAEILIITIPPSSKKHLQHIKNILLQIEKSAIKKVIYCSSIAVYGNQTGMITEETPVKPETDNAKKMVNIEQLLIQNPHFKTTILRFGGLIGNDRHPAKHLSDKILKQGQSPINLVHLKDCIGSIEKVMKLSLTGIFNIVTPYHPTKIKYYTSVCHQLKIPAPKITEAISPYKIISSQKIQKHYKFVNSSLRF